MFLQEMHVGIDLKNGHFLINLYIPYVSAFAFSSLQINYTALRFISDLNPGIINKAWLTNMHSLELLCYVHAMKHCAVMMMMMTFSIIRT